MFHSLLTHINNELEISQLGMMDTGAPTLYLTTTLDTDDVDSIMQSIIKGMDKSMELKKEGPNEGSLSKLGSPILFYRFNSDDKRLFISLNANKTGWSWSWLENENNELYEHLLNQAGDEGLFIWQRNTPLLSMIVADKAPALKTLGFSKIKSLALFTKKDTNYHAGVNIEMPPIGIREIFPVTGEKVQLKVGQNIEWAMAYTIPNAENIKRFFALFADNDNLYAKLKENILTETGLDLDQIINGFSGRWVIVADEYGTIVSTAKNHQAQFEQMIQILTDAGLIIKNERLANKIQHLQVHGLLSLTDKQENQYMPEIVRRIMTMPQDYYIKYEKENILISSLPQPLIAREEVSPKNDLNSWFVNAGIKLENNNFSYIRPVKHLALKNYYNSISYLNYLAKLTKTEIDLSKLPTAQAQKLPASGSLAFSIDGDSENLSISLNSPNGISDWAYDNNVIVMAAATGIVAGIVMPSYQDYVLRTKVTSVYHSLYDELQPIVAKYGLEAPFNKLSDTELKTLEAKLNNNSMIQDYQVEANSISVKIASDTGLLSNEWIIFSAEKIHGKADIRCFPKNSYLSHRMPTSCQ